MRKLVPVILSGGIGSRLWPESRRARPKQLSRLVGPTSLLQLTVERVAHIPGAAPPLIVCGEAHVAVIREQLAEIGESAGMTIVEPFGRSTAPAAAAAALVSQPDDVLLIAPADHIVQDTDAFVAAVEKAAQVAAAGWLVTFGVAPTAPEAGFGYIEHGDEIEGHSGARIVARFVEKPDLATAIRFGKTARHWWNSGMFVFGASTYLSELETFAPEILSHTRRAVDAATATAGEVTLDRAEFAACPQDSIDYAVLEHTARAAMVPLDAGWSDVGSWDALWEIGTKDENGNVTSGPVYLDDTTNSYVRAASRAVAVSGLDGVVVVETADAVLIVHRQKSQAVRSLVERLAEENPDLV